MRTYAIVSPYWIICDGEQERQERLKFHIERGDYFPFLATVIKMLGDTAGTYGQPVEVALRQSQFAEDMRKDLIYLHENYEIQPRKQQLAFTKEKVVRFDL